MAEIVTRKATALDLEAARRILTDGVLSGMARAGAFKAFVKGYLDRSNGEVNWEGLVSEMKELTGASTVGLVDAYGGASQIIASNWAREDLGAAMDWYAEESLRDLGNSRHSAQVASVLGALPPSEAHRVVDWIAAQRVLEGWNDAVIQDYSKHLLYHSDFIGADVARLVRFLPNEEARADFVNRFVVAKKPGGKGRKYTKQELTGLIEAGGFSDSERSDLLGKMELSK